MTEIRPADAEAFYRDDGDIIDQEGRWCLVRVPTYQKWESWIIHSCEEYMDGDFMGHKRGCYTSCDLTPPRCHLCKEVPPDRLQTLWVLHNYDSIQKCELP